MKEKSISKHGENFNEKASQFYEKNPYRNTERTFIKKALYNTISNSQYSTENNASQFYERKIHIETRRELSRKSITIL